MQSSSNQNYSAQIKPDWKEIEAVREACGEHLRACGADEDAVHALQMASAELLENAVKYGFYTEESSRIAYSLRVQQKTLTIEVTNPVRETDDKNFRRLDAHIQWIRGFQNAFEAYIEKLKEVSNRDPTTGAESGLGLVRIAYEGQSVLDFYVDEQNLLSVSAVYSLQG